MSNLIVRISFIKMYHLKIVDNSSDEPTVVRRRGKKLRKKKCRRNSIYGQQTEVRDPFEPPETQISQAGNESRRASLVYIYIHIPQYPNEVSTKII